MKKTFFPLTLAVLLTTQAYATPTGPCKPKSPKTSLERQLANYIAYPDVLRSIKRPGVVVIQFRVNADNELSLLTVFSQNEQINTSLTKRLNGKRLVGYGSDMTGLYLARLRLRPQ
jgi:hypothetical protein